MTDQGQPQANFDVPAEAIGLAAFGRGLTRLLAQEHDLTAKEALMRASLLLTAAVSLLVATTSEARALSELGQHRLIDGITAKVRGVMAAELLFPERYQEQSQ
jgi:hypothetical protein